jgi:tetratricopeptide (TPR) repeat protein
VADVFLSYARPDAAAAERIARILERRGWSVWIDRELPAHRAYADVIATELESAAAVLVVWSKASIKSEWVRSEANRARELRKLVQARVDDARPPMPFDQIQCADLTGWRGAEAHAGWSQVVRSVDALLHVDSDRAHVASVSPSPVATRRRLLLGGGATVMATVVGYGAWRRLGSDESLWRSFQPEEASPRAQLLLEKGLDALQSSDILESDDPGSMAAAVALLTQATQANPKSATAWGALALAYAGRMRASPVAERSGLEARSRSAAATALQLDPNESRALGGLRLLDPVYHHWTEVERADRAALQTNEHHPILVSVLAQMLGDVGRWIEAAQYTRKIDWAHFLIPGADRKQIVTLWSAGDLPGADETLQRAIDHWPEQPQIWRTRVAYLTYSGRPSEALQVLEDTPDIPSAISADFVTTAISTAKALMGTHDPRAAVQQNLQYLKTNARAIFPTAHACTALGAADTALQLFNGYYFVEGEWASLAPAGGDQDRLTSPLFYPPMKALWRDPRFNALLERIGLNSYWRQTRTIPDFRR